MFLAAQLRILCIDDTPDMLNVMEAILNRAGHEVHSALGGERGIKLLKELPTVDVVLINHLMPRISGMDVVSYLAAHRRYDYIGVVYNSAVGEPELPLAHDDWLRVDASLTLPFHPLELLDAVFSAYMRRRGFQYSVTYSIS
jgi:CheY-like chemotaxis protein